MAKMVSIQKEILENQSLWINLPVNFVRQNWDKKLYHFIPFDYFIKLLRTRSLHFVNILDAWGDEPYELCYFRPQYYLQNINNPTDVKEISTRLYAQCWTVNRESNAMWSIYSGQNKDGVRICTTLGKILELLYPINPNWGFAPYVGFMDYRKQTEIKQWILEHSKLPIKTWTEIVQDSLFIKRDNFKYEKELRIVLATPPILLNNTENPWKKFEIISIKNNLDFIIEATLSPFIDASTKRSHFKEILKYYKNGWKFKINQSPLYRDDLKELQVILK